MSKVVLSMFLRVGGRGVSPLNNGYGRYGLGDGWGRGDGRGDGWGDGRGDGQLSHPPDP